MFVATLELFGNEYDISFYENNECTEIKKSIVRNTRYEFLQYTDDFEKLIVNINGDLFILTEQQFDQVKEYYDMQDTNTDYENDQTQFERVKKHGGFPQNITPTNFLHLVKRLLKKWH